MIFVGFFSSNTKFSGIQHTLPQLAVLHSLSFTDGILKQTSGDSDKCTALFEKSGYFYLCGIAGALPLSPGYQIISNVLTVRLGFTALSRHLLWVPTIPDSVPFSSKYYPLL